MLKKRPYIFLLSAVVLIYLLFLYFSPKQVNWKRTFSKKHKYPYGNAATWQLLDHIFPEQEILISREPPYTYLPQQDTGNNFILVTNDMEMEKEDAKRLLNYVKNGSNAFIAAESFDGMLADTFGLNTFMRYTPSFMGQIGDSVTVNFVNSSLTDPDPFLFKRYEVQSYFDTGRIEGDYSILGEASDSTVNFIRMPFGKGNFYFHSNPLIFTNYNLLHRRDNHRYISKAWSYLPVTATIWDEYYHTGREEAETEIRYILSNQELRWAWFTLLVCVLLYFLFQSKRTQRIIPVISPLRNTTMEFVTTVGNLYFQQKDHTNLARKKATYFLENIRKKYYMKTAVLDEEFIRNLSVKSGVDETTTRVLTGMLRQISESGSISEKQLLDFNNAIENFNLKSKL